MELYKQSEEREQKRKTKKEKGREIKDHKFFSLATPIYTLKEYFITFHD